METGRRGSQSYVRGQNTETKDEFTQKPQMDVRSTKIGIFPSEIFHSYVNDSC